MNVFRVQTIFVNNFFSVYLQRVLSILQQLIGCNELCSMRPVYQKLKFCAILLFDDYFGCLVIECVLINMNLQI